MRGGGLLGAELKDGSGTSPQFRINAVEAQGDVWRYDISYQVGNRWEPLCPEEGGTGEIHVAAIALEGRWNYSLGAVGGGSHIADPDALTFACTNAALGKCVQFGYAPWRQVEKCNAKGACIQTTLADHHQACTRMVRADYCGDGRSFTQNSVLINLYDGAGIQTDTENWVPEAEWDAQGARCLSQRRLGSSTEGPSCVRDLYPTDCGALAHFSSGTLLMNEVAPRN